MLRSNSFRSLRLGVREFAVGDTVGPVAEILVGCVADAREPGDHGLARLAGGDAPLPSLLARLELAEVLRNGARGQLPELMTADATVVLHLIEIV